MKKETEIHRNDPCPCGSGKKYKRCCLQAQEMAHAERIVRERLENGLRKKIFCFSVESIPEREMDTARQHFSKMMRGMDSPLFEKKCIGLRAENQLELDQNDYWIHTHKIQPEGLTILELFAKKQSPFLSESERNLLQEWLTHRFGLWEIQEVSFGEWLVARDLFSELSVRSTGENTSRLPIYSFLLGRIESLSGKGQFTGTTLDVPRSMRESVMQSIDQTAFQHGYPSSSDFVHQNPLTVKCLISEILKNQKPPLILDWDGYPIKDCHAVYQVGDHKKLVAWIHQRDDMERTDNKKYDLLQRGKSIGQPKPNSYLSDPDQKVFHSGAELITATDQKPYRTIANLDIKKDRLEIFAVSEARLNYCRELLEKHLKSVLIFISEERMDFDLGGDKKEKRKRRKDASLSFEETQHLMEDYLQEHCRKWIVTPIPALDDRTPKEALHDPKGRLKLTELLKDFIHQKTPHSDREIQLILEELEIQPSDLGLKFQA